MKTRTLTPKQLDALSRRVTECLLRIPWRRPLAGESEPKFTGSVILPAVEGMLQSLRTPGLVLRGDGGNSPRPVSYFGVEFYPDLEIGFFDQRTLAVEVKFVRDVDPSGSISKALGQALIYQAGGFPVVHTVLIECRHPRRQSSSDIDMTLPSGITLHHFSTPITSTDRGIIGPREEGRVLRR